MANGDKRPRGLFGVAHLLLIPAVALSFVGGALWTKFKLWPWRPLDEAWQVWHNLKETDFNTRSDILQPILHRGEGVRTRTPKAAPGLTLISGVFQEGVELRLIDLDGRQVHSWPVDFFKLWPKPDHIYPAKDLPTFKFGFHLHGALAEPDGSIAFNIGELGLAKVDACGRPIWRLDRRTHHALTRDGQGGYWAPAKRDARKISESVKLPGVPVDENGLYPSWYEDTLLHIGPDGRVLKEISVLKAVIEGLGWYTLYDVVQLPRFLEDPTHVNDVELVTPALAAKIPGVRPGDLLVSARNLHRLLILDQDDGRLLWSRQGPWVRQHDPDIEADGSILVFDNNDDLGWKPTYRFGGSRVLRLDPADGSVTTLYPLKERDRFYTKIMGTQERLLNGDLLIVDTMHGRVFETTPSGEVVWDYVKTFKGRWAAIIEGAWRLPPDYFRPGVLACPSP